MTIMDINKKKKNIFPLEVIWYLLTLAILTRGSELWQYNVSMFVCVCVCSRACMCVWVWGGGIYRYACVYIWASVPKVYCKQELRNRACRFQRPPPLQCSRISFHEASFEYAKKRDCRPHNIGHALHCYILFLYSNLSFFSLSFIYSKNFLLKYNWWDHHWKIFYSHGEW